MKNVQSQLVAFGHEVDGNNAIDGLEVYYLSLLLLAQIFKFLLSAARIPSS